MPSPSATLDDADPFHATQPNAPFLSPSWGWQGQRGGEPAGLESPAAPSASAPRLPSVTFQVIHNNALEWARITSHRFFDEAQRGKISDAALATYAREWVAWNRHALLQLGWYPNRARRHRSPTAASPQRTGGGPLEGRSDAWAETELPSSASLPVPPSMRAFAWARPLLAEPLHDWMERLEAYRLALGGGDDDDDGEAHLPDAVFNNAFVGTPAAAPVRVRAAAVGASTGVVGIAEEPKPAVARTSARHVRADAAAALGGDAVGDATPVRCATVPHLRVGVCPERRGWCWQWSSHHQQCPADTMGRVSAGDAASARLAGGDRSSGRLRQTVSGALRDPAGEHLSQSAIQEERVQQVRACRTHPGQVHIPEHGGLKAATRRV
eukprot:ctg_597.g284